MTERRPPATDGFTLLEVILALAVLAVSLAIIGEANSAADRNAHRAALESDAMLVAESVMAELVAGVRQTASVADAPWQEEEGSTPARWSFSIAVQPAPHENLLAVRVTVEETQPIGSTPVRVSLDRWLADPTVFAAEPAAGPQEGSP